MPHAHLLPESEWRKCPKCKIAVPEFEFSPVFGTEIDGLLKTNNLSVMTRIIDEAQCEPKVAKAWMIHHLPGPWNEHPPCPHCGMPLRTGKAKQCRFCGKDWH